MKTQSPRLDLARSSTDSPLGTVASLASVSCIAAAPYRFWSALGLVLALLAELPAAHAAPPEFMTYQGFLVDANGNALAQSTPANYPVLFRIFTASTGGTRLWSEQQIVTVDKGNFSVILGEGTPVDSEVRPLLSSVLAGPSNADRYMSLSVTIGSATTEMLPRLRLLPAPYAFTATSANNLVNPGGTSVVTYANSRVEVNGNLSVSGGISGNGSGLTGLTLSQLPALNASSINLGTLPDAQLSGNVARRDVGNAFTGNQSIAGNLGVGMVGSAFPLTIGNNTLGDKISLFGQSGNTYGFGIQGGLLQIHSADPSSDVAFGYGSSAAMTETMRIKGNGNVGIGLTLPSARLSLSVPGSGELSGSAHSTTLRTYSGLLGPSVNNELALASFGYNSGNQASLGIRAIRATAGGAWETAAVGLGMDVDNTVRAGGASLWLHGNGNIGIGTTTPTAKLEVNGAIKATSVTVNGTISAATFTGTFNGEKAPAVYQIPPGNLGVWRDVLIDGTSLLGDSDGGRIKIILRHHSIKEVRTLTYEFYAENDADNFNQPTRYGWTVGSYGQQRGFRLGSGNNDWKTDIASDWDWFWIRNYRSSNVNGTDTVAFGPGERYKFWAMVPPNVSATIIVYDR